jgi:hypothetical protein
VTIEAKDVLHLGAAPAVDGLVVVAHGADVLPLAGEELEELELAAVRVLVLVDEQVPEALLVLRLQLRVRPQQLDRQRDEIVEVHRALGAERRLVAGEDLGRHEVVVVALSGRPNLDALPQRVLRRREHEEDAPRVEGAVVHLHLAHAAFHQRDLVAGVADAEAARQPRPRVLLLQEPQPEAVERRDEHLAPGRPGQRRDAPPHLFRGLVGEGDGEDALGLHALHEEPGDAVGDDARLPGPGPGQHEQRPLQRGDRLALGRVERREVDHGAGRVLAPAEVGGKT